MDKYILKSETAMTNSAKRLVKVLGFLNIL